MDVKTIGFKHAMDLCQPEKKQWFRGVRSSKFRHVYGIPSRKESSYIDINIIRSGNDCSVCATNPQFLAIVADATFVVIPINQTGRIDFQCCKVMGHTGQILDLKWNPFDDNMIASASDDCSVRIWSIPDGGLTNNLSTSEVELFEHRRKVIQIEWHPTASNVLISAGYDNLIIIWDIMGQEKVLKVIKCHVDMIYSMALNRDGSLIATTSKDKKLRVIEPRNGIVISEGVCHMGSKCTKVVFLNNNRILTTGFSKHSDRQYAIWDQHNLNAPLVHDVVDSSNGVVTPFFDYDTKMLYLAGKGDGNIRYYEIVDEAPYIYYLNQFLSGNPQKALGIMPKRGLDVSKCEIFRFYKLLATGYVCETISMIVPRKSTTFQYDIYPDTLSIIPATNSKDWMNGKNATPNLMSLQTGMDVDPKEHLLNQLSSKLITVTDINIKPTEKKNELYSKSNNNSRKFEFLSNQTIPDYRPQQITDKNLKTTANTSTKLCQMKLGQIDLSSENVNLAAMDNGELQYVFRQQVSEIKKLKNQLAQSDERVRELEYEVKRLQQSIKK